jgi:hypothetical protein
MKTPEGNDAATAAPAAGNRPATRRLLRSSAQCMTGRRAVVRATHAGTFMDTIARSRFTLAACVLAALALFAVLPLHLLPALLAGLLVFAIIDALAPRLERYVPRASAHGLVALGLSVVVVGLLTIAVVAIVSIVRREVGDPSAFLESLNPLLDRARGQLPRSSSTICPTTSPTSASPRWTGCASTRARCNSPARPRRASSCTCSSAWCWAR